MGQYFCDTPSKFSKGGIDKDSPTSCDLTFKHISYCDLFDFSNGVPEGLSFEKNDASCYFSNPDLGLILSNTDFCPIPSWIALMHQISNFINFIQVKNLEGLRCW